MVFRHFENCTANNFRFGARQQAKLPLWLPTPLGQHELARGRNAA